MGLLARIPLFWRFQIAGWTLLAVCTTPLKLYAFHSVGAVVLITLVREPLGLLLTSLLRLQLRRLFPDGSRSVRLALFIGAAAIVCGAIDAFVGRSVMLAAGFPEHIYVTFGVFCYRLTLYVVWSLLYFYLKAQRAAREHELNLARAETAARDTELQLLRAQADPHFLFNSLNTILSTLEPGQHSARRVVEGLAAYLRYSLQHRHDTLVPLHAEYEATLAYLAVEQERFRGELIADCRLDDRARDFLVPGVLLQPLVENAVKYARQTSEPPYRIRLQIDASLPGVVSIVVANTGDWVEPSARPGPHGTGLANLRQRLALLYPRRHELALSPAGGWVTVRVSLNAPPSAASSPPVRHAEGSHR